MKLIIKGFVIGIGKILPGISGSVLAISLGEYKNIISSLNSPFNKKNMIYLLKIMIGMICSIIIISKLLFKYIDKYNFIMFTLFVGLIMGTIPKMSKKINKDNYLYIGIGLLFMILINSFKIDININQYIKGFIIGFIESISTIIPGISGTAILTNLSLYKDYLLGWSKIYDFDYFGLNLAYYIPFIMGLIISSILLIKIVNYYLFKYENKSNGIIFGFMIGSIYLLMKMIIFPSYSLENIFIFIINLIIGFIIGFFIDFLSYN